MNPQMHERNRFSTGSRLRDLWPPASRSGMDPSHDPALALSRLLWGSIAFFPRPLLSEITPDRRHDPTPLR